MLDKNKCDAELGKKVNNWLETQQVQTPLTKHCEPIETQLQIIESRFEEIMEVIGLDLTDDSLKDTPKRMANMFVNELFWGLDINNFPKCTAVDNKMNYDEMVIEKNIKVATECEHHLRVIWGKCHVAYLPNKKVIGLSKMNRIVEYFSRRPQIQERLTEQIYFALQYILDTDNIAVVIDAEHYCVKQRGIEDINSSTITSKLGGVFKDKPEVRSEFMRFIK
jgi:GTP cyclohydrolase I